MIKIDLTTEAADLLETILPHAAGVESLCVITDSVDYDQDYLLTENDTIPTRGYNQIASALRAPGESDVHLVARLVWEVCQ